MIVLLTFLLLLSIHASHPPTTGDFQPSLEALSIGLPVVTFPSDTHIGGRYHYNALG